MENVQQYEIRQTLEKVREINIELMKAKVTGIIAAILAGMAALLAYILLLAVPTRGDLRRLQEAARTPTEAIVRPAQHGVQVVEVDPNAQVVVVRPSKAP